MLAEKLKALKNQKNWSNLQLAEAANLPIDTVNKILAGTTRNPNTDTLRRMASALGTTVDEILGDDAASLSPSLASAPPTAEKAGLETIINIYEHRLEKLEATYERRLEEAAKRETERDKRFDSMSTKYLVVIIVLICVIIYLIVDALHGNWGFFQYSEALRNMSPTGSGTASGTMLL